MVMTRMFELMFKLGTAQSSPPLRRCLPSMEKVTYGIGYECLKTMVVRRSESRQSRTSLSSDTEAASVPAGLMAMALIPPIWPVQGSPTWFQVDVSHSRMVGSKLLPHERRRIPSGVHAIVIFPVGCPSKLLVHFPVPKLKTLMLLSVAMTRSSPDGEYRTQRTEVLQQIGLGNIR